MYIVKKKKSTLLGPVEHGCFWEWGDIIAHSGMQEHLSILHIKMNIISFILLYILYLAVLP